jgi:cyclopropane-fatty-acyl-phospholipid synthase
MSALDSITTMPARAIYGALLRRVRAGVITVDIRGAALAGAGNAPGPTASITVRKPWRALGMVVTGGGVGFAEAYMAGMWDTPDLTMTLETLARNVDAYVRDREPGRFLTTSRRLWQRLTARRRSEISSIGDHYNLGNDFYTAWLDATMTYSSAVFGSGGEDLTEAQHTKYRRLAGLADIQPGDHVLEIGCGWGGFAEFTATEIGAHVTGLTLSTEQAAYARERLEKAGVADRTEIKVQDFREETGNYDKIVSIEMIESIPADLWPALFDQISARLRPNGKIAIQAITIDQRLFASLLGRDDFISKHIFPGGALPSVQTLDDLASERGLIIKSVDAFASSYARTLRAWGERFDQAWPALRKLDLDERFRRTWRYYLAYCEAGFRTGRIDVHQLELVN